MAKTTKFGRTAEQRRLLEQFALMDGFFSEDEPVAAVCMTCMGRGDWINPKTGNIETCPSCGGSGER